MSYFRKCTVFPIGIANVRYCLKSQNKRNRNFNNYLF